MKRFTWALCGLLVLGFSACGLLVEEGREVLAEIDGEPIRLNDLLRRIREIPFEERTKTNDVGKTVRIEARRRVLRSLVVEKLLAKEAQSLEIVVSEKEAESEITSEKEAQQKATGNMIEGMKGSAGGHEDAHGNERPSRAEIKTMAEKMMIEKLIREKLSDSVARKYYDEHVAEFTVSPPLFSYEMLVVDVANRKFVDAVYRKAVKDDTTLAAAASSVKDVSPIVFSGVTPLIPLAGLVPAMREKVESLTIGEVSKPFPLQEGNKNQYGVARVVNRMDAMPFESVKGMILQKFYQGFIGELEKKYKVVYHEDKLDYRLND